MLFRDLKADEIECRVAKDVKGKGCSLLLYKDARCDMNILDEAVGNEFWQREHYESKGNLFCRVGIYSKELNQWVWKSDCGIESRKDESGNEKKGEASDSFKRACFNWGIGRELYTSPFIWVDERYIARGYKDRIESKWYVKNIKIEDKKIVALEIADKKTKVIVTAIGQAYKPIQKPMTAYDVAINTLKVEVAEYAQLVGQTEKQVKNEIVRQTGVHGKTEEEVAKLLMCLRGLKNESKA